MNDDFVAWPRPVLKPEAEWSEFDRDFLDFMRIAFAEGFQPRHNHSQTAIEAQSPSGRSVFLIYRGRVNGWEPILGESGREFRLGSYYGLDDCACVCIRPPFRNVADFALKWLRGSALSGLLSNFEFTGGCPAGITRRSDATSEVPHEG